MHSLQKKPFLHAAGEKSTHSDICKFAEFYHPQERTLNNVGRQMFCTPVFFQTVLSVRTAMLQLYTERSFKK
jgi:hypothetical protein